MAERGSAGEEVVSATDTGLARRDWLQALSGLALLGGFGQAGLGPVMGEASGGTRTADASLSVDERIQRHRTGELQIVVEGPNGEPVEGADVTVSQRSHDFGWGTAVNADTLLTQTGEGDNYREYITELFNTAVLENRHKWRFFEEQQDLADQATRWLRDQGLDVRGHVCVWGNRDAYAVPADVETAIDEGDAATVRQRSMEHIETIVSHYGDDIEEWEVVNEVIHEPSLIETVDGADVEPVEAPILADWYQQAEEVRPAGVSLAVNDYNTLAGPYADTRSQYERQIEFLQGEGVDLGSAGMQSHFSQDETLTTDEILRQLDTYAATGLDLKITEFDMADDGWAEADKAEFFEEFLRAVFSHPAVTDVLLWGFWDGRHWQDDAPLFDADWSAKPSYEVYSSLVFDEWWTDERGTTDADGQYATAAFLGDHEITVTTADGETVRDVSIRNAGGTATLAVTVDDPERGDESGSGAGGDTGSETGDTPASDDAGGDSDTGVGSGDSSGAGTDDDTGSGADGESTSGVDTGVQSGDDSGGDWLGSSGEDGGSGGGWWGSGSDGGETAGSGWWSAASDDGSGWW